MPFTSSEVPRVSHEITILLECLFQKVGFGAALLLTGIFVAVVFDTVVHEAIEFGVVVLWYLSCFFE